MKTHPWTYCHYSRFWHRLRRNSRRCPHCGAVLGKSDHRILEHEANPNPVTDPKEADVLGA